MGLISYRHKAGRRSSPHIRITTILIVEDEPLVAFDNEHALTQAGYHVVATVDRYAHAVESLGEGGIDLVVADVRLTGRRGGVDVARYALALGVPVLFSTGTCPPDADALCLGWIAKPYAPRDLVRAIRVIDRKPRLVPEMMTLFPRAE
ncbi:MAG TPA: response regulator [Sphingobium sp.]|uniref:response regulator n=1 Tax=Sphingobium sp. TaxID=1912891 RepID=UPI002ED25F36